MKFFITVNAQTAGDGISAIGAEQARALGKKLAAEGFFGKIYTSNAPSAKQTAEIIADIIGSEIIFDDGFRELDERLEGYEDARYRVALSMRKIMEEDKDALILTHQSAACAVLYYLYGARYNVSLAECSYSYYDTQTKSGPVNCTRHIPYGIITQNGVLLKDKSAKIEIPEELKNSKGTKILHIGDTHSLTYYWYGVLIRELKPDVIIHTGDTADEVKVGRIDGMREEYADRVKALVDILTESGAEIYWTSGNNDVAEIISKLAPSVKIVENDSVINLCGRDFCLCHNRDHITKKADFYLYGHSLRYEIWSDEKNTEKEPVWYMNAMRSLSVIILPERKIFSFSPPRP